MFTVYDLVDPRDGEPFYVGITENVYDRFLQHINCEGGNFEKNARIMELRGLNLMVVMRSLQQVETRSVALLREKYWIEHYVALGKVLYNRVQKRREEATRSPRTRPIIIVTNPPAPALGMVDTRETKQAERELEILRVAAQLAQEKPGKLTRSDIKERLGWNNKMYPVLKAVCDAHGIA